MKIHLLLAAALGATLLVASCGGEEQAPTEADALEVLRAEVAQTYEPAALEALLVEALAIATRHPGTPLGDEAFAFAEQTVLERYSGHAAGPFASGIPSPPDQIADSYVQDFRNLAAFAAIVPAPYRAAAVLERFSSDQMERARRTLRDLEWARNNRVHWAAELANEGATDDAWFGLFALAADGSAGASRGTLDSEDWAREHAALLYMRDLAVRVGPDQQLLDGWDLIIKAVVIANFEPSNLDTRYEDGSFITRYSEGAVAAAAANAAELTAAINAAREYFPPVAR